MRPRKEINRRVGANIQRAREQARYTQEELSELLSITPNHLSAIERGERKPTLETLYRISLALEIKMSTLVIAIEKELDRDC